MRRRIEIDWARDLVFDSNIIYEPTSGHRYTGYSLGAAGFAFYEEGWDNPYQHPPFGIVSDRFTITNNIFAGTNRGVDIWGSKVGGFSNAVIANNVFITNSNPIVIPNSAKHYNVQIRNNVFYSGTVSSKGGLTWSNNCWRPGVGGRQAGPGDLMVDPGLVNPAAGRVAGSIDANQYRLQAGSPCRGAGIALPQVTRDFWGTTRSNPPDIGAHEY